MDVKELRQLKPEMDLFLDRFAPLFGREETQTHANQYLQGLLLKLHFPPLPSIRRKTQ